MATDIRPITVENYLAMILDGTIPHDARLELLDGRLVEQMTKYPPHNFSARQLGILLKSIVPQDWLVSEEKSLALGRYWRPEPDLAIIRGPNERYRSSDPKATDFALLIEVADSSYAIDRGDKWRAYATARIPVYWIVNINQSRIEVYREPTGRGKSASYQDVTILGPNEEVSLIIDGQDVGRVRVGSILP
jgi:Uma2 family endonuclease